MLAEIVLAMAAVTATDQTVNVTKGTKLDVTNFAGDVSVKVWDRDAVRVQVTHSDREIVDIKPGDQVLTVRSRSVRGGRPRSLDYDITVPRWMAISVDGTYVDANLEGVGADVAVETTHGDIRVNGGSGFISLKSVRGEVTVEKARGRVEVRAVNQGIRLADITADLSAETTNGSIILDRVDSSNVDLYTVNGNISYDGPIKDKGLYRLTTHNGLVAVAVPEKVNAVLTVRTYNGSFRSSFPLKTDDQNPRKRFTVTLGNGSAHLELESFGGTIALRRPGEPRPETERRQPRERDQSDKKDKGFGMVDVDLDFNHDFDVDVEHIERAVQEAMLEVQPEIERAMAEAQPEIERAMADAQPEIEAAIAEAMAAFEHAFPQPNPHPRPQPRQPPQPKIR